MSLEEKLAVKETESTFLSAVAEGLRAELISSREELQNLSHGVKVLHREHERQCEKVRSLQERRDEEFVAFKDVLFAFRQWRLALKK